MITLTLFIPAYLNSVAVFAQTAQRGAATGQAILPVAQTQPPISDDDSFISKVFGNLSNSTNSGESFWIRAARALVLFALAAVLAACLAFRPHKDITIFRRNPFVAQTQILLAVVGAAMMIVVADNAARAIGIFAAAALIRFRTNIRNPKEITVLLVCLSIGLASGVGRWEIAVTLTIFALLLLWPLERFESSQVYRAMELKIKTRSPEETDEILKDVFQKHGIIAELRKFDREDEKDIFGTILYYVSTTPKVSIDKLSKDLFSADSENIDSVEWNQKKSRSYIYR